MISGRNTIRINVMETIGRGDSGDLSEDLAFTRESQGEEESSCQKRGGRARGWPRQKHPQEQSPKTERSLVNAGNRQNFSLSGAMWLFIRHGLCPQTDHRLGGDRHINKLLHIL